MPVLTTWTEDRTEKLRKLRNEGFSANQIATELGDVSRNAVCGKVYRLGLSNPVIKKQVVKSPRKPYGRGPSAMASNNRLQRDRERSKARRLGEKKENQKLLLKIHYFLHLAI